VRFHAISVAEISIADFDPRIHCTLYSVRYVPVTQSICCISHISEPSRVLAISLLGVYATRAQSIAASSMQSNA
jgi:hypothetical protein